ncbi:MAG: cytochrome P450, partial [Erythrobacter sp.]
MATIAPPTPMGVQRPQVRREPTSYEALKQHFETHPEERLKHTHPWDVSRSDIYFEDKWQPIFAEMRKAGPLHYIPESPFGPYWA